jgi:UDP-N-acetylglucosamine 4,6-dehydratase
MKIDKRVLNYLAIIFLSFITFSWTFFIFHDTFQVLLFLSVVAIRMIASTLIFRDYSLSWSKASQKTFLIKSVVYVSAFIVYLPIFYGEVRFAFLVSELFAYLLAINFFMYSYYYYANKSVKKNKTVVIYGAGKAGLKLEHEFRDTSYQVKYFIDDDQALHKRSIDGITIISKERLTTQLANTKYDLLVIAMPSVAPERIKELYENLHLFFHEIKVLPAMHDILQEKDFSKQLKDISVEDLLARHPKDLDKKLVSEFIYDKTVLVTGAGGSIGSEIVRQTLLFKAKRVILVDHSEINLYTLLEEIADQDIEVIPVMTSVVNDALRSIFEKYSIDIVIHAAAYKHVPLVEDNKHEAVINNVIGTKHCIDLAIEFKVGKFVLISTDKAVRPTNVMGTTKRICELYAQNVLSDETEIVAVRFGNVLGSSVSVIPKFKKQIEEGKDLTVTHPDITRYFMLIPEACELVLQAASIGQGGEIFILDMGEPVKIVDLAQKLIDLSGKQEIGITFSGLRPGEKLYEELLIDDSDASTDYDSITVAKPTLYDIDKLNSDINLLVHSRDILATLKVIVPEFEHKLNK